MEYMEKIIDSYAINNQPAKGTDAIERLRDLSIRYYYDNGTKVFVDSPLYSKVPQEKVFKILEKLEDYTSQNSKEKKSFYPWSFISHEIEYIVFK